MSECRAKQQIEKRNELQYDMQTSQFKSTIELWALYEWARCCCELCRKKKKRKCWRKRRSGTRNMHVRFQLQFNHHTRIEYILAKWEWMKWYVNGSIAVIAASGRRIVHCKCVRCASENQNNNSSPSTTIPNRKWKIENRKKETYLCKRWAADYMENWCFIMNNMQYLARKKRKTKK